MLLIRKVRSGISRWSRPSPAWTDEYLKGLAKTLKGTLEEAKKQNLVLDYKILLGNTATPQDFDILIMVESKNMAALDNGREKFDPIARKVVGTTDQQQAMAVKRLDIREIVGSKLMREICRNPPSRFTAWRLFVSLAHGSLNSPACSCVSITLPASS